MPLTAWRQSVPFESQSFHRERSQRRDTRTVVRPRERDDTTDRLLELGVSSDMLDVLRLLPMFAVAWSDGRMTTRERETLLASACDAGIPADGAKRRLVDSWLRHVPDPDFEEAWRIHADSPAGRATTRWVMTRARIVAQTSSDTPGNGSGSTVERRTLDRFEAALAA